MFVHQELHGTVLLFRPAGRLDSTNSPDFETLLLDHLDRGCTQLVLDLVDLDYISSAGLRVILLAGKRLRASAGRLVLARLRETVKDLLDMSGFLGLFPVAHTLEEALQSATS
jgi:anti-anti-sigma factor